VLKNGLNEKQANELFDLLEKFAGYGLINRMPQRML
jgi:DNA polymerase III alpha subunit